MEGVDDGVEEEMMGVKDQNWRWYDRPMLWYFQEGYSPCFAAGPEVLGCSGC